MMAMGMHAPAASIPVLRGPCPSFPPGLLAGSYRRSGFLDSSVSTERLQAASTLALHSTDDHWLQEAQKEVERTQLERKKLMQAGQTNGSSNQACNNDCSPAAAQTALYVPADANGIVPQAGNVILNNSSFNGGKSFIAPRSNLDTSAVPAEGRYTDGNGRVTRDAKTRNFTVNLDDNMNQRLAESKFAFRSPSISQQGNAQNSEAVRVHNGYIRKSFGSYNQGHASDAHAATGFQTSVLDRRANGAPVLQFPRVSHANSPAVDNKKKSAHVVNSAGKALSPVKICETNEHVSASQEVFCPKELESSSAGLVKEVKRENKSHTGLVTGLPDSDIKKQSKKMPVVQKKIKDAGTDQLVCSMKDVLVVDSVSTARSVVGLLRGAYRNFVHSCDTEVADIDVKKESPVGHGKVICFSIYCGAEADFGGGKSCVWVDVLDGEDEVLDVFKCYFEDNSIKKVWHNFSFDKHVLANHGISATGFYADTMHLARLWNSGRKGAEGGYSLESLTSDVHVMNGACSEDPLKFVQKTSMKDLFGKYNIKKDGTEGKIKVLPSVVELQTTESSREKWICYSAGDAVCTWRLWESLMQKLKARKWVLQNRESGSMYDFYCKFWQPFGELLAGMEAEGMLVDRKYLAEIEQIACKERSVSINRFRKWAAKYCSDAQHINVTSDAQIRQLLFGGFYNISKCRTFQAPNVDGFIEEGKKAPKKNRPIEICGVGVELPCEVFTSGGLPAVSMQALKALAGKVSVDYSEVEENAEEFPPEDLDESAVLTSAGVEGVDHKEVEDLCVYGAAYGAFNGGERGKEACMAIAALCEVSAIDTLISSFIQPLQGGDIMGTDGRVHCSLNLNTETGRLSARRPNLQNQPALEKDRYKIRQAFIASPGKSLIVADYGQLELRLLAHLANCKSMLEAFKVGGDFHSRTAMNMYDHVRKAVENVEVLLEWEPKPGESAPPCPLLKDVFGAERRKAKMLNFSIAYGKTAKGLAKDWKVSLDEAQKTVELWYRDRHEVRSWQEKQKMNARTEQCVYTLLGRARHFPDVKTANKYMRGHIDRAAINTPVQGSAADVAMLAMLEITCNAELKDLGWKLLLQVHDEMILEGPTESADIAKALVVQAMSHPFQGKNILNVELAVDAKYASSWYAAK